LPMSSSHLLSMSTFVFGLAAFFLPGGPDLQKTQADDAGTPDGPGGGAGNTTAGLLLRWVESYQMGIGHAPLSNLYESLVFLCLDRRA
jgi:ABC-type transport system involved in cytochrome c biogenesis permease subunit